MTSIAGQGNDGTRSGMPVFGSGKGRLITTWGCQESFLKGPPGLGLEGHGEQSWKPTPELSCLESWDGTGVVVSLSADITQPWSLRSACSVKEVKGS